MIQIYDSQNTDFEHNGDETLFPEECKVSAELNGTWVLNITHPIDDEGRWKYIEQEAVIAVPTFMGKKQLFRIDRVSAVDEDDSEITAVAYPIFWDSGDDLFLSDCRPTNKTGQEALNIMLAGSKYTGQSNITRAETAYFERRNLMDALNGEDTPTFVQRWGGEILYDNYKVIVNERAGGDYGAEVRYRKNMSSVQSDINMENVVTRIVPVAYNGYTIGGNNGYVDSENIDKYAKVYTKEIYFEDVKMEEDTQDGDEENGVIICQTQEEIDQALTKRCKEQYEAGIDLPAVTLTVGVVDLEGTEEYKDFQDLVKISLGDTVRCYNTKLDITTEARCIGITWDCIKDCVDSVTLGDYQATFVQQMASTIKRIAEAFRNDGNIVAEKIFGVINAMQTQLKYQQTAAQRATVRAILFEDMDKKSPLYGAMAIGTQGIEISKVRTADGRDWDWTTAMTAAGIVANTVVSGMLSDKTGKNYWDLDNGIVHMDVESFSLSGRTATDIAKEEAESAMKELRTISMSLTNEFQAIPVDASGNVEKFPDASTTVSVALGKKDITELATYTITLGEGVSGSWNLEKKTYTITGCKNETGYVEIQASFDFEGENMYAKKRFTVSKLKQGESGEMYMIDSVDAVTWNPDKSYYEPLNPTITAYKVTENGREEYVGDWTAELTKDWTTWVSIKYQSKSSFTMSTKTQLTTGPVAARITLYKPGTNTILARKVIQYLVQLKTQRDVFNMLTNNGAMQGLYVENGKLYVNAQYMVTGILADRDGKSYWNLDTGEMQITGMLRHYSYNGTKSVEIINNQVRVYDWTEDGNYVGSIGATKRDDVDRVGVDVWCDTGDLLTLGFHKDEADRENVKIRPVIQIDANTAETSTPWIRNTKSGKIFANNSSGGITIENGLIKDWSLYTMSGTVKVGDAYLEFKDGLLIGGRSA